MVAIIWFAAKWYNIYQAQLKWKEASVMVSNNKRTEAMPLYEELYPKLNYSGMYLYNYGAELSLSGDYQNSLRILKETENKLNDADFYNYLGNTYEGLGDLANAEKAFLKSSLIVPHQLYPQYRLVYLWAKTNKLREAINLAQYIINKKPKVQSDIANQIKQDLTKFVELSMKNVKDSVINN